MKVFVVNGLPRVGKDEFVDYCIEQCGPRAFKTSVIDPVKKVAKICDWDGVKTPESRKFLSDLKDLLDEYNDFSFYQTCRAIRSHLYKLDQFDLVDIGVVFIIAREPQDIDRYVAEFGAKTILIRRMEVEEESYSNHADQNVLKYKYDIIINNKGTLSELKQLAQDFIDTYLI